MGGLMAEFDYNGKKVRAIPSWEMTLGDLDFIRQHFEIPGQVELENGMGEMEPKAWRAFLVASIRQVEPGINPKDVNLDHVAITPIILALNEEANEHSDQVERAKNAARPTKRSEPSRARSGASSSG